MKPRGRARVAVLQALYEIDTTSHDPQSAFEQRTAEDPLPEPALQFARALLLGVVRQRAALDQVIKQIAPEWPLDQIAVVDRNILRMAVYELLFSQVTPLKIAINEAIELAKTFGSDTSPRFVNGALGTLVDRLNEFVQQVGKEQ